MATSGFLWCTRRAALLLGLGAGLSGCGFRPVYERREGRSVSAEILGSIRVAPIPERSGQILRTKLVDRLSPRRAPARPRYRLLVRITESEQGVAVRKDTSVTRLNLTVTANFTLFDTSNGEQIASGRERVANSFDRQPTITDEFANIVVREDALFRGLDELANLISRRIALFFQIRRAG